MEKIFIGVVIFVSIVILVMVVYVLLRKYVMQKRKYTQKKREEEVYQQIEGKLFTLAPEEFKNHFSDPQIRHYIYRVLKRMVQENGYDFHGIFDEMGFTREALTKVERNSDRQALKDLSIIKSPTSYAYLLELLQSDDIELSYRAGYAIAYISLEPDQKKEVLEYLIQSGITHERVIEIIVTMDPPLNLLLDTLKRQHAERGKIIILNTMRERVIGNTDRFKFLKKKLRIQNLVVIDQLMYYLNDSPNVAIAAIDVLSDTQHPDALDCILKASTKRKEPPVLAAVADSLSKFSPENRILDLAYELAQHDDYWVRLASFESLSRMGNPGYRKIFDLSMNSNFLAKYPSTYYLIYQIISDIPEMAELMETYKREQNNDISGIWHAS